MVLIITLAVFITIALLSWALMTYFIGGKTDVQERLDKLTPQTDVTIERRGKSSQFHKTLSAHWERRFPYRLRSIPSMRECWWLPVFEKSMSTPLWAAKSS